MEFEKRLREMRDHPNLIDGLLQKWQKIKIEESENKKTKYQLPTIRKIPYLALSFSIMATLGILAVSCVILVIMYRLFMVTFLSGLDTFDLISDNAKLIASISSAMLNFIFIKS